MIWKALLRRPACGCDAGGAEPSAAGHRAPAGLRLGPPAAQPAARGRGRPAAGARWPRWTRRRRRSEPVAARPATAGTRARTAARRARRGPHAGGAGQAGLHESQHAARQIQAAYRQSVFSWLRERRLEVARQHLAQGWSVQQARISSAIATPPTSPRPSASATAWPQRTELNQRADAMAASSPSPPSVFPRFAVRFRRQPLLRRHCAFRRRPGWATMMRRRPIRAALWKRPCPARSPACLPGHGAHAGLLSCVAPATIDACLRSARWAGRRASGHRAADARGLHVLLRGHAAAAWHAVRLAGPAPRGADGPGLYVAGALLAAAARTSAGCWRRARCRACRPAPASCGPGHRARLLRARWRAAPCP